MSAANDSSKEALPGRIGSVAYLNARPLIHGLGRELRLEVPSVLAREIREGHLDAALIPVAECLEYPHYQIVPGIAIASRGAVKSVYLAYRGDLRELRRVTLDPASRTSNLLLQVLMREFLHLEPEYTSEKAQEQDARLLIGDAALLRRKEFLSGGWYLLDLGSAWQKQTGFPFVYAVWAIREGIEVGSYARVLTQARDDGIRNLEAIIAGQSLLPAEEAREYFTKFIHYELGPEEVRGLIEFQKLCLSHGLIEKNWELRIGN